MKKPQIRRLLVVAVLVIVAYNLGRSSSSERDSATFVTSSLELQHYTGKRVLLCGRYHCLGIGARFHVVWFGVERIPIAIANLCPAGSPIPNIPDGALIAVVGRLTDSSGKSVPADRSRDRFDGLHLRHETVLQLCPREISVEEVQVLSADDGCGTEYPEAPNAPPEPNAPEDVVQNSVAGRGLVA
ncbi:MAG: hypothetical protein ABFC96_17045 [Thermoguttaceae bacterium]